MIWDLQIDYPFHHILEYTQYKIVWRQFMKRKKKSPDLISQDSCSYKQIYSGLYSKVIYSHQGIMHVSISESTLVVVNGHII